MYSKSSGIGAPLMYHPYTTVITIHVSYEVTRSFVTELGITATQHNWMASLHWLKACLSPPCPDSSAPSSRN